MRERINWVDRAKTIAVCSMVFCHLPQSQEWFYYRYMQAPVLIGKNISFSYGTGQT